MAELFARLIPPLIPDPDPYFPIASNGISRIGYSFQSL